MQLFGNFREFPIQDSGNDQSSARADQISEFFRVRQNQIRSQIGTHQIVSPPRPQRPAMEVATPQVKTVLDMILLTLLEPRAPLRRHNQRPPPGRIQAWRQRWPGSPIRFQYLKTTVSSQPAAILRSAPGKTTWSDDARSRSSVPGPG